MLEIVRPPALRRQLGRLAPPGLEPKAVAVERDRFRSLVADDRRHALTRDVRQSPAVHLDPKLRGGLYDHVTHRAVELEATRERRRLLLQRLPLLRCRCAEPVDLRVAQTHQILQLQALALDRRTCRRRNIEALEDGCDAHMQVAVESGARLRPTTQRVRGTCACGDGRYWQRCQLPPHLEHSAFGC